MLIDGLRSTISSKRLLAQVADPDFLKQPNWILTALVLGNVFSKESPELACEPPWYAATLVFLY